MCVCLQVNNMSSEVMTFDCIHPASLVICRCMGVSKCDPVDACVSVGDALADDSQQEM